MTRYPLYRDSGLPWLREVPSHWYLLRGKWLFRQMNRPVCDVDEVVTAFRDGTVTLRSNRRTEGFTNAMLEIGYQGIRRGDLVIHAMDAFAGAIGVSDSDGKATPVYAVCTPIHDANPYYYSQVLRVMARSGYILSLAKGIRERSTDFRFAEFASLELPVPPRDEQDAIVAFLDRKLAEIDSFIAAKERLIALLKEQKAAIINRAVTRGLDLSAPTKHSGIEWLGHIPAHWDVVRFSAAVDFQEGPGIMAEDFQSEGVPLLRISSVNSRYVTLEGCNYIDPRKVDRRWSHFRLREGNLLISASASMGTVSEVTEIAAGAIPYTGIIRLVPVSAKMNRDFLRLFVVSAAYIGQIDVLKAGATIQHYGPTHLRKVRITLPPLGEQAAIVEQTEARLTDIGRQVEQAQASVQLMREYRTALISEVVTGKIDVRAAVAEEVPA